MEQKHIWTEMDKCVQNGQKHNDGNINSPFWTHEKLG